MDSLKIFYYKNQTWLSYILKGMGISFASFFGGFFIYYIANRKRLTENEGILTDEIKIISEEEMEKLTNKIKNAIIHYIMVSYDELHKMEQPPIITQKIEDEIEITDIKEEKNFDVKILSNVNSNENSFIKFGDEETSEPKIVKVPSKSDEVKSKMNEERNRFFFRIITEIEMKKLVQYKHDPKSYFASIKEHRNNQKIQKNIDMVKKFMNFFQEDKFVFKFNENLEKNYLKIISNIFYLNIRKAQKKFKDEIDQGIHSTNNPHDISKRFNELYRQSLKETRSQVVEFFKVEQQETLSPKILLRIYPYFFRKYETLRKDYDEMNELVNQLISKIQKDHLINELYYDSHPDAITKPVDTIIDFKHFFQSSTQFSSISIPLNEKSEEEEKKLHKSRILETVNSKYNDQ